MHATHDIRSARDRQLIAEQQEARKAAMNRSNGVFADLARRQELTHGYLAAAGAAWSEVPS